MAEEGTAARMNQDPLPAVICPWNFLNIQDQQIQAVKSIDQTSKIQTKKLSYAEIAKDRMERTINISDLPVPEMRGDTPVIRIPSKYVDKGLNQMKFALVTRIDLKGRRMIDVKAGLNDLWSEMNAKVSPLGRGYFLVRFDNESAYNKVKFGGPWRYGKQLMRLSEWLPNFNVESQKHSNAEVWVKFPGLSMEYWELDILMAMGRTIGNPVMVDRNTLKRDNGFYACVLVDIDMAKRIPERILVEVEDKSIQFWQDIQLGKLPDFCNNCKVVGHLVAGCRFLMPEVVKRGDVMPSKRQAKRRRQKEGNKEKVNNEETDNEGFVTEIEECEKEELDGQAITVRNEEENCKGLEDLSEQRLLAKSGLVEEDNGEETIGFEFGDDTEVLRESDNGEKITTEQDGTIITSDKERMDLVNLGLENPGSDKEEPPDPGEQRQNQQVEVNMTKVDLGLSSDGRLVSSDEEIIPDSQVELVKEADIVLRLLEGKSKKNQANSDDLNSRRLVAKISKKKVGLLAPGPLKDRLLATTMSISLNED